MTRLERRIGGVWTALALLSATAAFSISGAAIAQPPSLVHVANNTALSALSHTSFSAVMRDGFASAGDAPPLVFTPNASACSLNSGAGDGGSQVPTSDGGCWNANFVGAPDAREWSGASAYPFTLHVSATGTNAGWCFSANPCQTLQYAVIQALRLYWNNTGTAGFPTISLDGGGSFSGAMISGTPVANGSNEISGTYLAINGNGTASVTAAAGQVFSIEASDGASALIENLTLSVANGNYGTFVQNPGTTMQIGPGVICTGAATAQACLYTEGLGLIELSTSETLKVQGTFVAPVQANSNASVEFDPGTFTIDCGTGLTIASGGAFLDGAFGGHITYGPTTVNNCASATGDLVRLFGGAHIDFTVLNPKIPGNLFVRDFDLASSLLLGGGSVPWAPSLGTCNNGTLNSNSTNYTFSILFGGANSSCAVLFGKPSNASAYFASPPVCTATGNTGGAGPTVGVVTVSNAGFTLVPSSTWILNQAVYVNCAPLSGG